MNAIYLFIFYGFHLTAASDPREASVPVLF